MFVKELFFSEENKILKGEIKQFVINDSLKWNNER